MDFDFIRTMSGLADSELLEIVTTERKKYKKEALLAAENELNKRNISFTNISEPITPTSELELSISETALPVNFSSNEMNEENPEIVNIKIPAKGNVFIFIIGIFLIVSYGMTILFSHEFSWGQSFYFLFGLYTIWQNGIVKDTNHWKFKPVIVALVTFLAFTLLLFLYIKFTVK